MKKILFLIVLTFISCSILEKAQNLLVNLHKEAYTTMFKCLRENGAEVLLEFFKANVKLRLKRRTFSQLIEDNKESIKKTKELFQKCKISSIVLQAIKSSISSQKTTAKNNK